MPNTLLTPTLVIKDAGRGFVNSVRFFRNTNRTYDDKYRWGGAKVGYTVHARMPVQFDVTDGQAYQPQNLLETSVPITLTNQKGVHFGWSSASAAMEIEEARARYIDPATQRLANAADVLAYNAVYRDVYQCVGTPGTVPSAALTILQGKVKLDDAAVDTDGRVAILDTWAMANISNAQATLFNPPGKVSETWRKGQFGANQLGFDEFYVDQNRSLHTTGSQDAASPTVNSANQTGSSLIIQAWTNGVGKKGDKFTLAGVFSVNPVSKVSTGRLQDFALTADVTAAGGAATLSITPSIITSGPLQTVSNSPANSAAVSFWGTAAGAALVSVVSPQSMLFHPDAFAFVMADLEEPEGGADCNFVRDKEVGISIRWVRQYQGLSDINAKRLEILIGAATLQAWRAVRMVG